MAYLLIIVHVNMQESSAHKTFNPILKVTGLNQFRNNSD